MKAAIPLALCLGLLAACGDYPMSPVARGTEVTGPIDGIYAGRETLVEAKDETCPLGGVGTLQLGDVRLLYPYSTHIVFVSPVADDGKVHATVGQSTLDGSLTGGTLAFEVKTPACQSTFRFARVRGF